MHLSDPLTFSKLDRVVFEQQCRFLREMIGKRAVLLYPGTSNSTSLAAYQVGRSAYVSMEIALNKNRTTVVVFQAKGVHELT